MPQDKIKSPHAYIYGKRKHGKEEAVIFSEDLEKIKKMLERFFCDNDNNIEQ